MTTKPPFRILPPRFSVPNYRLVGVCFVVLFLCTSLKAQTTIYTQPFSGTLAASGWTNTNLTVPWGNASLFGLSNVWRVNDNESGLSANTCGAAGMGDQSLHMVCAGLASGAAYLSDINTNRRISSPNINTTGYTGITLDFDYIGNGESDADKSYLVYSIDGGTNWIAPTGAPTSTNPAMGTGGSLNNLKSQICSSGQGRWTHLTWNMPVSCEGITNFRVGFVWQSNNNSSGSDPSFAVDDVTISGTLTPAPIELISFDAEYNSTKKVELKWITASEINNNYFSIERSSDALNFYNLFNMQGAGNSSQLLAYHALDDNPISGISYYRLKQTDYNGDYKYSQIEMVESEKTDFEITNCLNSEGQLEITINSAKGSNLNLQLFSIEGRCVYSSNVQSQEAEKKIRIPIATLCKGIYIVKASDRDQTITRKIQL